MLPSFRFKHTSSPRQLRFCIVQIVGDEPSPEVVGNENFECTCSTVCSLYGCSTRVSKTILRIVIDGAALLAFVSLNSTCDTELKFSGIQRSRSLPPHQLPIRFESPSHCRRLHPSGGRNIKLAHTDPSPLDSHRKARGIWSFEIDTEPQVCNLPGDEPE